MTTAGDAPEDFTDSVFEFLEARDRELLQVLQQHGGSPCGIEVLRESPTSTRKSNETDLGSMTPESESLLRAANVANVEDQLRPRKEEMESGARLRGEAEAIQRIETIQIQAHEP